MSKSLEALCYLDDIAHGRKMSLDPHDLTLIIEKELKALEIIRNKLIDIQDVILFDTYSMFNQRRSLRGLTLITKEEYDLLKEVLK